MGRAPKAALTALATEVGIGASRGTGASDGPYARRCQLPDSATNWPRADLRPSYVVNNAGFGLLGISEELDRAEQLSMIDLNVRALTELSLRWIESLRLHKGGLLNVASVAAFLPGPNMAVYYASKAYVLSFTEALHAELAPQGVRVTVLCPGPVPTAFQARAGLAARRPSRALAPSSIRTRLHGLIAGKRIVCRGCPTR